MIWLYDAMYCVENVLLKLRDDGGVVSSEVAIQEVPPRRASLSIRDDWILI